MKINKLNREKLPFAHLSPSSVVEFLTNEKSFFKRYVLYKWDERTSPALIIWTAFHFAMEQYYNSIIAVGEGEENAKILEPEEIINHGVNQMKKQFGYHEKRGLEKLVLEKNKEYDREIDFERFYEHYINIITFDFEGLQQLENELEETKKEVIPEEVTDPEEIKKLEDKRKGKILSIQKSLAMIKEKLVRAEGFMKSIDLELDRESGYYNEEIETAKSQFIEYWQKGSKEKAQKELVQGIINYINYEPQGIRPIVTEISETSEFQDFDWNDMPIALKGKPDLLAMMQDDDVIVDYKLVSQFGERNGAYEIQASNYYFIAQGVLKRKPKKMLFIETSKKEIKAGSGLLKPELTFMCNENNIPTKKNYTDAKGNEKQKDCTVDELKELLVNAWILEVPQAINIIEIDFEEDPGLIQAFIEIYKEILNRSYYFFIEKTLRFLPNPKADFTGAESWADFKYEIINDMDPIRLLEEGKIKEPEVKIQF